MLVALLLAGCQTDRAAVVPARDVGAPPTVAAADGSHEAQAEACATGRDVDRRIFACTHLLQSGKLAATAMPAVLTYRGIAYTEKGDYTRAMPDFDLAIAAAPSYGPAYYFRGYALSLAGDRAGALAEYAIALAYMPGNTEPFLGLGYARLNAGEVDRAVADFDTAIERGLNEARARVGRGYALLARGVRRQNNRDVLRFLLTEALAHPGC